MSRVVKSVDTDEWLLSVGVRGEWGMVVNGYEISFLDDGNVLKLNYSNDSTTL